MVNNLETWVRFLGWEDPLEEEVATHSSILAQEISGTVAHQAPLSMGLQRVGMTEVTQYTHTTLYIRILVLSPLERWGQMKEVRDEEMEALGGRVYRFFSTPKSKYNIFYWHCGILTHGPAEGITLLPQILLILRLLSMSVGRSMRD